MSYVLKNSGYANLTKKSIKLGELFEDLYSLLLSNYRCEYIYKNILANEILLARHAPPASTLLTEFRVGNCKADVVILNGTSSVYEIKTELDSLDRLSNQTASYLKVFDKVYVVTHESQLEKLLRTLDESLGIILLTETYNLQTVREAWSNKTNTDAASIFDCLRQSEYCELVKREFGSVPDVPNTQLFSRCRQLVESLEPESVHDAMVGLLKERSSYSALKIRLMDIPQSLKLLYLANKLTAKQHVNFVSALSSEFDLG